MLILYARVSTTEQIAGIEAQERELLATGCTAEVKLFSEMTSSLGPRPQLQAALDYVREGDTFVVTRLDRLARSTKDLLNIVQRLEDKNVSLRILDFGGSSVDTRSATGRLMLVMFSAFAQFEIEIQKTRQIAGIAKAKAEGRYKGRAPTARKQLPKIQELSGLGIPAAAIAQELNISRASVYRLLKEQS